MLISNDVNLFMIPKLSCKCPYCEMGTVIEDYEADEILAKIERGENVTINCDDCEKDYIINSFERE